MVDGPSEQNKPPRIQSGTTQGIPVNDGTSAEGGPPKPRAAPPRSANTGRRPAGNARAKQP